MQKGHLKCEVRDSAAETDDKAGDVGGGFSVGCCLVPYSLSVPFTSDDRLFLTKCLPSLLTWGSCSGSVLIRES